MDKRVDGREEQRELHSLYHARQAEPPAALDEAIKAAARRAVGDAPKAVTSAPVVEAPVGRAPGAGPWWALAACTAMVALLLPGLLRESPAPVAVSTVEVASDEAQPSRSPAALAGSVRTLAEATNDAVVSRAQGDVVYADAADIEAARQRVRELLGERPEAAMRLGATNELASPGLIPVDDPALQTPPRGAGLGAGDYEATEGLIPQHRFEGRFRPGAVDDERVNVTLLDTMVVIEGDWVTQPQARCEPLLALDRHPGESAAVSVTRIAAREDDHFLFLRVASPERVRLVHCTADGWVISTR